MKSSAAPLWVSLCLMLASGIATANGRQPCDRGAGGISHCQGDSFICNDGRISGSKRSCSGEGYSSKPGKSARADSDDSGGGYGGGSRSGKSKRGKSR